MSNWLFTVFSVETIIYRCVHEQSTDHYDLEQQPETGLHHLMWI